MKIKKLLTILAVLAIALAAAAVSIEAQRGGGSRGGGSGGSGGGMHPEPNVNDNTNGNFPSGNYDVPAGGCDNYGPGNYEIDTYNYELPLGNYDALEVCVSTDKRTYTEGEPIEIDVIAHNPTDSTITLVFTSGTRTCQASYAIDGVERGSTTCTADMDYISLLPRGSYYWIFNTLNAPREIVFPVEVGRHSVVGIVGATRFYRQSDPVTIRVVETSGS